MAHIRDLYKKDFDSHDYAKHYLIGEDYEYKWIIEDFYHRLFKQGKLVGKCLIEVGCGPSMRSAPSASACVPEIYLADFAENNRTLVEKWLKNDPDTIDLSSMFKYVADLEGKDDIKYLEDRVRKTVKGVYFCDILADNPLSPQPHREFDIVTTSYCIDCYPDYPDYLKAWKGLATLLRPGGMVINASTIGCSAYTTGDKIFPAANMTSDIAKKALVEAGFKLLEIQEFMYTAPFSQDGNNDCKGTFILLAQKV